MKKGSYLHRSIPLLCRMSIGWITCFYMNLYKIPVKDREVSMRGREEIRARSQIRFSVPLPPTHRPQRHNEPGVFQQPRDYSLRCRCRSAPCSHHQRPLHLRCR